MAAVIAPIAIVVSCGDDKPTTPPKTQGNIIRTTGKYTANHNKDTLKTVVDAYNAENGKTQVNLDAVTAQFTVHGLTLDSTKTALSIEGDVLEVVVTSNLAGTDMVVTTVYTLSALPVQVGTKAQAKSFIDKVLGALTAVGASDANSQETKAYAAKVLVEFNAGIALNGIVTGKATGDLNTAPTSNNNYDHTKSLVRVLDNEDQKLSFSFNMSIAKSGEFFKSADATKIGAFLVALKKELVAVHAKLNNVGAGFYKSTQRINGVAIDDQVGTAANPNTGPDDYFRFAFNIVKANIVSTTGISATTATTVISYSELFSTT